MISAFGPVAETYAAGLGELDAIVVGVDRLIDGYVEAVRRRSAGEAFYGMLLIEENRDRAIRVLAPCVLGEDTDADYKRAAFSNLGTDVVKINGRPSRDWLEQPDVQDPVTRGAAREFLQLCPALLVRSAAEHVRISALTKHTRPYEVVVNEPVLPRFERRPAVRPSIVIWAPECVAEDVLLHAFALVEFHGDVTLVSADGIVPPQSKVTAYRAGDRRVADALAGASCVVVPNANDPGAAVAFARRGFGVVAPLSSGAAEFVAEMQPYDLATTRKIHVAVTAAMGRPASVRALPAPPPRTPPVPALPVAASDAPPATIVVPTYNRRDDLARCLEGIGAQTYPNMRAVVVNDAGEAIDDVVGRFPFAQLLNLEANVGVGQACMEGLKLVDDGFVVFLSDDDCLYPDHIQRLATAMLLSGAAYGHSNTLIRYVERLAGGALKTTGFNCGTFNDTVTPAEALISTPISGQSILWRTSVFDEIGGWRVELMLSDQEIQLRAGQHFAMAYVDQVTCEWRIHGDNFSGKVNPSAEQRRIYEDFHPTPGRPWLNKTRDHILGILAERPAGYVFPPTVSLSAER